MNEYIKMRDMIIMMMLLVIIIIEYINMPLSCVYMYCYCVQCDYTRQIKYI